MITIYFKTYKHNSGRGTAYYKNENGTDIIAKDPYIAHRKNHIATINCYRFNAVKL